jgi:CheY-like chemotaxis protein
LSKLLEKFWGHTVECVYSGLDVFEKAKVYQPEIIFLDIGLPGLNGHEVAASLKADAALQNIVLVALTGYGQVEDRQRSADVGFNRHWIKPVSVTTLQTFFQEIDSQPK